MKVPVFRVGIEDPLSDVQGLAQVIGRSMPPEAGPEKVQHTRAVEAGAWSEGKQLHYGPGLPEPPGVLSNGAAPHANLETAEQLHTYGLGIIASFRCTHRHVNAS